MSRPYDPFAPAAPAAPTRAAEPEAEVDLDAVDLDKLHKAELVALAEQYGLDTTGTRADLIARLRAAGA